jgi:hypothetical protein
LNLCQSPILAQFSDALAELFLKHEVQLAQATKKRNAVKLRLSNCCKNGFAEPLILQHNRWPWHDADEIENWTLHWAWPSL